MTYQEKEQVLIAWLKKQIEDAEVVKQEMKSGEGFKYFEGQQDQAKWTLNLLLDLSGQGE